MAGDGHDEVDRLAGYPHPREARGLIGHGEALAAMAEGLRSGRLHHAWLIGGPEGIGKATFAYHVAKYLFTHGQATSHHDSLPVDQAAPGARQVMAMAHPDLIVLRRQPAEEKKAASTRILVGAVRRALDMFGTTAGSGGWRVCIVDSAEDLNESSANALLKVVEEPPARSIFLIVAHQPQRVLPTIRSRCRKLMLRPLPDASIARVLADLGMSEGEAETRQAIALAGGSVRRALIRLDAETAELVSRTCAVLDRLPGQDLAAVLSLCDSVAGKLAENRFAILLETVEDWLAATVAAGAGLGARRLAPLAEVWDKTRRAARETEAVNLDRRPLVLAMFQDLADAVARMRTA
jgi:DNA polymerase III subunit delta'